MRILPINNLNIRFTSDYKLDDLYDNNEVHSFIQDDDECCSHDAHIRDAIRAHMFSQFLPTYGSQVGRANSYAETLDDVYIQNLQKISTNSYRGATLAKNIQYLELLKKQRMNTVIDLVGYLRLEDACKNLGIEYLRYPVSEDYWGHPIFRTDKELKSEKINELSRQELNKDEFDIQLKKHEFNVGYERRAFMRNFTKLIDTINREGFYIGCEFGEYRTPNILALNTYFNPNWKGVKTYPTSEFIYTKMKNMYQNMTQEEKIGLGFNESFEENLKIKLGIVEE